MARLVKRPGKFKFGGNYINRKGARDAKKNAKGLLIYQATHRFNRLNPVKTGKY